MGPLRAIFDTNIVIDYLKGIAEARVEMDRYAVHGISIVTWMEVMAGTPVQETEGTREALSDFRLLPVTMVIAERAVIVRRQLRLKLPDAVILATALEEGWLFVTRNTRDFREESGVVRVPYSR